MGYMLQIFMNGFPKKYLGIGEYSLDDIKANRYGRYCTKNPRGREKNCKTCCEKKSKGVAW